MERWRRLGRLISRRRAQMGLLSRPSFARFTGVSKRTLDYLENGTQSGYRQPILDRVEAAVGWVPGSIDRFLEDGTEPVVEVDEHMAVLRELWPQLPDELKAAIVRMARGLADL